MIWSNEEELTSTLERVKKHCARLKDEEVDGNSSPTINLDHVGPTKLPPVAVGVERDLADNRDVRICLEPFDPLQSNRSESLDLDPDITPRSTATMNNNTIVIDDDDDDDSLEVIAVHPPKKPVMQYSDGLYQAGFPIERDDIGDQGPNKFGVAARCILLDLFVTINIAISFRK